MPRMARVVAPGVPHHVTQRGNRRLPTFFCDDDYRRCRDVMAAWCARHDVQVWAYGLMPNQLHLIAVPTAEDGLSRAIGEEHRRYTLHVNTREGWQGHLWQGRFGSFPMDDVHLLAATRYVELNPARAGLVSSPEQYPWSSAAAHLAGQNDVLVKAAPMLEIVGDWGEFLSWPLPEGAAKEIRRRERTGRPWGSPDFVTRLERTLGRLLRRQKPGPRRG